MSGNQREDASQCDRTKPRENVATVRRKKIAVVVVDHTRTRGPGPAAQDLAGAEPRLRILLIGIGGEAGKRSKRTRGPFPYIADSLPAAPGAVARSTGGDIDDAERAAVQIGMLLRRGLVTPRIDPLGHPEPARRRRLRRSRNLPFRFGGQSPIRPPAPGVGLMP